MMTEPPKDKNTDKFVIFIVLLLVNLFTVFSSQFTLFKASNVEHLTKIPDCLTKEDFNHLMAVEREKNEEKAKTQNWVKAVIVGLITMVGLFIGANYKGSEATKGNIMFGIGSFLAFFHIIVDIFV